MIAVITPKILMMKIVNSETNINCKESLTLKLENGDNIEGFFKDGLRHGLCVVSLSEGNVAEIRGNYKEGKLDGKAKITFKDRSTVDGYFKTGIFEQGLPEQFENIWWRTADRPRGASSSGCVLRASPRATAAALRWKLFAGCCTRWVL